MTTSPKPETIEDQTAKAVDPASALFGLDRVHELTDEYIATVGLLEEVQRLQKMARKWDHNCALYWLQQKESAFIRHLRSLNHNIGDAWDGADKVKPNASDQATARK